MRRGGAELDGSRRLRLDAVLLAQVTEQRTHGLSIREIARRTGVSRTKVDRYLRAGQEELSWPSTEAAAIPFDPLFMAT